MRILKEIHKDIVIAKSTISRAERELADITTKLLLNLEYEKAGAALPFDYAALHAEAEALRADAKNAPQALTDEVASYVPSMFPTLEGKGALVKAGTKINWNGALKRAAVDLWDTEANSPANAPTLWEDVAYVKGYRVIPEVITATAAFAKGEQGIYKGEVYTSLIDNNVWTPEAYAAGWSKEGVTE